MLVKLELPLMRTLLIARIPALSTKALAYFLPALLNAAIGFEALTHPKQMLHEAVMTVRRPWPTSLRTETREASAPYHGTAPITSSTMRTQRTRQPTCTTSCPTPNQRYGRCSY